MNLRPYQDDAVDGVRRHIRSGRQRVLLVAPTGAGKTVIATHIVHASTSLGNRVLFLAHRRELIVQAWKKIVGCACPVGFDHVRRRVDGCAADASMAGVMMASDPRRKPVAPVQVASIDTLRARSKPPATLVIIDETHRALAKTYRDILAEYPEAAVIGLTATPYRADGRGLGELYTDMVVVASPRDLIGDGFLVEPRVFTVPAADLPELSKVRIKGGDYDAAALSAAVDQSGLVGNIVEHWQRRAEGRRTVVFAVDVEHSKHIVARFVEAGVAAEHLDGTTPTADRDAILARLEAGETRVVSNVGVLCEGWDQPSCKCVVLARPTKSTGLYLQMAGRILRPHQNTEALILDHAGNVLEHGLPQDDREFSLDPPKRRQASKGGPAVKTCEECYAIAPAAARECPACGAPFAVAEEDKTAERDGELVEVRAATADEKRAEFDRLVKLASERGYRGGWVYHRYREKYGVGPPAAWSKEAKERITERPYTLDEKHAYLERLKAERRERGHAVEWLYKRYHAKFGEPVPGAWMLSSGGGVASIDAIFAKASA